MSEPTNASNSASTDENLRNVIRQVYGRIAQGEATSCCGPGASCCGGGNSATEAGPARLAMGIGYTADDLATLPEGSNMGLSCGAPLALATLQPGEVLLDLGSGGGFDVFLAGPKVGPSGRAIGVDMTAEMLAKARRNVAAYQDRTGLDNVEFRLGEIEHLPVADASVDVIISNCVINLSPDKPQVWREIARVLKPGGRVSVSDIALLQPLPEATRGCIEALVGCVAGAVLVEETLAMVQAAGLTDIQHGLHGDYIDNMVDWSDPVFSMIAQTLPPGVRMSDLATSLSVTARKPGV